MKLSDQVSTTRRAAKQLGLASLLFFTWVILASASARADTFNLNANILTGPYAGTDVITGTIDINTITGVGTAVDITVTGGGFAPFTGILGGTCSSPNCAFYYNSGFADFGQLFLGNTVGYAGGSLGSGSYIDLKSVLYDITGNVTPEVATTPEPNSLLLTLTGMSGLLFFLYRRRLLPGL